MDIDTRRQAEKAMDNQKPQHSQKLRQPAAFMSDNEYSDNSMPLQRQRLHIQQQSNEDDLLQQDPTQMNDYSDHKENLASWI